LEEEVRLESLVRDLGPFARFLELAALESGHLVSYRNISQELGPTHNTIAAYYEILQDCLIMERINPITKSASRKKMTKSSKFLFFDLGVRRVASGEGFKLSSERMRHLFEHYVGLEFLRQARFSKTPTQLKFWRDHDGPEVDWVIDREKEYKEAKQAYIVCKTPRPFKLAKNITALPWQELDSILRLS
jgi:uncharacterized protein